MSVAKTCRQRFSFSIHPVFLSQPSLYSLSVSSPKSTIRCCRSERERRVRDKRWDFYCICQRTTEGNVERVIKNGSFLLSKAQARPTDIPGCLAQTGTLSPSLIAAFMWSLEVKSQRKRVLKSRTTKPSGPMRVLVIKAFTRMVLLLLHETFPDTLNPIPLLLLFMLRCTHTYLLFYANTCSLLFAFIDNKVIPPSAESSVQN